ncbi:branched-chain amino acid ABC transporter permease [Clostridium sp. KNHs216]|uniref:branched-chain amino acid ABC transporter permease n=1 Tax=Clostridium sp. KNHs216 TaxID=1550235 RepID=UPI002430CBAA|nr:branched-chain amino acid ABC transporter permease [Clostridium sp. KNHs216]
MFVSVLIGGLVLGCTYAMLSLGFSLIYQASGYMNFTQANLLMFGAFLAFQFYSQWKFPFAVALILSVMIMFGIGWLMERCIFRVLVAKHAKNIYVVLSTIALSIITQNAAMLIWDARVHYFPKIFQNSSPIRIGKISIAKESVLCIGVAICAMLALHFFLNKTKFGTSMRAAAQNKTAASCMGINVNRTIGITYGIAAALACLGGVLVSPTLSVSYGLGDQLGNKAFCGAVIGGYGNIYGAVVGALIIGLMETFVSAYISSTYKEFVVYGVLILVMILKPSGIFNAKVYDQ